MNCSKCGAQVKTNTKFCSGCGARQEQQVQAIQEQPSQNPFKPTKMIAGAAKLIGAYIYIDEPKKLFRVGLTGNICDYSDLVDFELIEDGETLTTSTSKTNSKTKSGGVGRAVVGGVLFGGVGAVVGAGLNLKYSFYDGAVLRRALRKHMPNTFFLVPGYGAQGGKASEVMDFFDKDGRGCVVNSSRGIIAAYKNDSKYSDNNFGDAARASALNMKNDIRR